MENFFEGITHVRLPHAERASSTTMDSIRSFITKRSVAHVRIEPGGEPFMVYSIEALLAYLENDKVSFLVFNSGNTARLSVQHYRRLSAWLTSLTVIRDKHSSYCTLF